MQKFYRDKSKRFECNVSVDGAKISETKARLVLEFPNQRNLLFYGNIQENGKCEIVVPALKEIDECEGTAILEIIAETTYFESWTDDFTLDTNKKVTVEMVEKKGASIEEKTITPHIKIITKSEPEKPVLENVTDSPELDDVDKLSDFKKYIKTNKINLSETIKSKEKYLQLLVNYKKKKSLKKNDIMELHDEIVSQHKKHLI
jgi:hypothetical protein